MLKETIGTAVRMKVITPTQIKRVNVDTTVQTKAVRYPTDARPYVDALLELARARQIAVLTEDQDLALEISAAMRPSRENQA